MLINNLLGIYLYKGCNRINLYIKHPRNKIVIKIRGKTYDRKRGCFKCFRTSRKEK